MRSPGPMKIDTDEGWAGPSAPAPEPASGTGPDAGLVCLTMLARYHGLSADPGQIAHRFAQAGRHLSLPDLLLAARHLGLHARVHAPAPDRLAHVPLPALAQDDQSRFFVVARVEGAGDGMRVLVHAPLQGAPRWLPLAELREHWHGELVLFTSRVSLMGQLTRFDFSWFVPAVVKYRRLLLEVLAVSLVLQLFALVTPLFFQVVMDKVLVHQSLSTLDVIAIGLLVVSIFEVVLGGLRSYVFSHTSSRIDVELGARMFRHLLALPMAYFQARRVGDSVARVRELENIRSFLTGNAITVVLDLVFSVVFIAVMLLYSG